jgi:hypothetical protein
VEGPSLLVVSGLCDLAELRDANVAFEPCWWVTCGSGMSCPRTSRSDPPMTFGDLSRTLASWCHNGGPHPTLEV